ncbi:MAG TPA: radical SAM protein, partial [Deltaproteobacteria bacterium]|nr:radical SAM protein [Deltaproteobacteria bacterium]
MFDSLPSLVFADASGGILDFPDLAMVVRSGDYLMPVSEDDIMPLPEGSQLYVVPDRLPVGIDRSTGEIVVLAQNPYDNTRDIRAVS